MRSKPAIEAMWAAKLGFSQGSSAAVQELIDALLPLLLRSKADTTRLFRRLCALPEQASDLEGCFYQPSSAELQEEWQTWLERWRQQLLAAHEPQQASAAMRRVNPAITWREWLIAPAYQQAEQGDFSRVRELQALFRDPYSEPTPELAAIYDRLRPREFFNAGGVSHYSCSS